jgi:hypothetical protein
MTVPGPRDGRVCRRASQTHPAGTVDIMMSAQLRDPGTRISSRTTVRAGLGPEDRDDGRRMGWAPLPRVKHLSSSAGVAPAAISPARPRTAGAHRDRDSNRPGAAIRAPCPRPPRRSGREAAKGSIQDVHTGIRISVSLLEPAANYSGSGIGSQVISPIKTSGMTNPCSNDVIAPSSGFNCMHDIPVVGDECAVGRGPSRSRTEDRCVLCIMCLASGAEPSRWPVYTPRDRIGIATGSRFTTGIIPPDTIRGSSPDRPRRRGASAIIGEPIDHRLDPR